MSAPVFPLAGSRLGAAVAAVAGDPVAPELDDDGGETVSKQVRGGSQ